MPQATVVVVEDDDHTRAHIARAVRAHRRLSLSGEAGTCDEGRELVSRCPPDVLLTDLGLPDGNGIDLIRTLRARRPESRALVITVFGDERSVVESLEAGASGYLLKDGTHEEIGSAIDQLLDGGAPISPHIARYLLKRFHDPIRAEVRPGRDTPSLTGRETEVLELIAKGFGYAEIARLLGISAHTVTTHVRHIYGKLEVRSRGEAVYEAVSLGLIRLHR